MTTPIVTLKQQQQSLEPDPYVNLFVLDASVLGGGIFRFSNSLEDNGANIKFNGNEYPGMNFSTEGFAWDGETMPRPKITASIAGKNDLSNAFLDLVIGYNGAQGATLYRIRTFERYLDGHEDAGCDVKLPIDVYLVDRIMSMDKSAIQWELIAPTDLPGIKLPNRVMCRDCCTWVYRSYDSTTSQWTYNTTTMACPYTGTACYTKAGVATSDKSLDVCGHKMSDCVLRYGAGKALPYGGFPGLARNS